MTNYSRYASVPVDRDLERLNEELRALPRPERAAQSARREGLAWLRPRRFAHLRHA